MRGSDGNIVNIEKSRLENNLRIMIDSDLKFSEYMHMVTKKANGIMAVIRRTFSCIDFKCFNVLYKSPVRPHLEYGVITWFPCKMKDIELIENVWKRATKQVKQIKNLAYLERLAIDSS